ncbi:MAG: hypothetical protein KA444_07890 [Bacteroidia bacterium]|nr:hypothetical protein [Bacteroidia bacterium]
MKKIYFFLLIFLIPYVAHTQTYGNSWINYNQQYFKVKVWEEGIYRISRQTLLFAGIPVSSIDPRKVQVFRDGQEQFIYLEGETDGIFDPNDFIEFYGKRNDGTLDKKLYADSTKHANPNYSLCTDTAIYFITWSATLNGKRLTVQNNTNFSSYTPANYFTKETYIEQVHGYNRGANDLAIEYEESEGWSGVFGNYSCAFHPLTITANTANIYVNGPNMEISTAIGGVNNQPHNVNISFPGTNFSDVNFTQELNRYLFSISPATFTSATTNFVYDVTTTPACTPDYSSFFWLSVKYPHTYDMENASTFTMYVQDDVQGKTRMDISNFNGGTSAPVMYDLSNNRRISVVPTGSIYQAIIDNDGASTPKKIYLSSASQIRNLTAVSGINYVANNFGYFNNFLQPSNVKDSAFIIVSHKLLWSQALAYKTYRDATTGGKVLLCDIEELYDQFAYGVQKHPLSIKNFAQFLLDEWTTVAPPQHLFLLGKSISPADFRQNPALFAACLVPSYGVPTSDLLLTSGINGSLYEPVIPVGRISAQNGTDVSNYLLKVQEYEAAQNGPPQEWMKEILHFGGGDNPNQQEQLASYLKVFENVMEDSLFGGNVTTYLKSSTNPIVINQSDSLQAKIDAGVSVMTFFGHASGSGFDQSTDEPSEYGNHGRYPVIVANSCFAGDIHTSQRSVSEKFVLEPGKAAIGFIASVGQGIPPDLYGYSNAFFENASYYNYGASIGYLMKKAIQAIQIPGSENIQVVCNEMSLHGDPSLKLNNFNKPDYVMSEPNIRFTPAGVTTDMDTFSVHVSTRNWGKAVQDSFYVHITRTFPDGTDSVYSIKRGRCYYNDDVVINVTTGGFNAAGINRFKVDVDLPDSVNEYDNYTNNTATTSLFITSNDIIPVYPSKFAIHPYNTVTLKATTANPLAGSKTYMFEIDTLDMTVVDSTPGMQRSPMYRFTLVTDSGGVITWTPPNLTLQDSTVYFWRVANDSIHYDPVFYKWQESSFMYVAGKTGYAQSHFYQFKNDLYENIEYNTNARKFDFVQNNKALKILTYGTPSNAAAYNEVGYYLNNAPIEYNGCQVDAAVMIAVLDSISLEPWNTCANNFGQANQFFLTNGACGTNSASGFIPGCNRTRPENYFFFRFNTPAQIQSIQNFINQIPDGNYILAYNWFNTTYSTADPGFVNSFTNLGFTMSSLQDNSPFALFIKKGFPLTKIEQFGNTPADTLNLNTLLNSIWNRGTLTTEVIGPATRWESLHWNQNALENPSEDLIHLNILGLNSTTNLWDTLKSQIQFTSTGIDTSLAWISASTYKYIKLQTFTQDDSLRTPGQMKYWRIYYDDVPECAVNPNRSFYFYNNPLQEGDTIRLNIAVDNLGNLPMDSLSMHFYLYDDDRVRHELPLVKLDSLRVGQFLIADLVVDSTYGLGGNNSLWVEANPIGTSHQLEKYHFNNIAEIKFSVNRDYINPILDVTFDGVHILDGDIVSGKPNINIQLHDENKFLALNDTANFKVYVKAPNSNNFQRVYFNSAIFAPTMTFTSASLPKNSCRIDWNPEFLEDGTYIFEVEATDASKNESGKYNYRISFEVINRSTITEVLNYPNPFSTSTRFVFTLTGNEVPTYMKIQIMTVTGKIVREIMQNELGNIHIGRNITDYAWDGRDEFGDQLANGLYLYRVISDINGEAIEHRETDADKYFKKGWGKMYLMR